MPIAGTFQRKLNTAKSDKVNIYVLTGLPAQEAPVMTAEKRKLFFSFTGLPTKQQDATMESQVGLTPT